MLTMNRATVISETKDGLEIGAPGKSDFFIDLARGTETANAPFRGERVAGDFVLRARVRPEHIAKYDAGGLFVYGGPRTWVKLAFELTDLGYPSVVSVVTDKGSDDANGERQDGREELWLQVARKGEAWALHWSVDGRSWRMARYFSLKMKAGPIAGFIAQSPVGKGCVARFDKMRVEARTVKDLRAGR